MKKPLTFIHRQKINFILYVFLEILQRCCKLVVLGTLGIPGYVHPNWYYQLVETFVFISAGKKNQIHPPCFSGDIAKICKLFFFLVLWACLITHTQNDSINLYKTSVFSGMSKIHFIVHFFLEILHFKEFCNLIGWKHFGEHLESQNFARYGIGGEISTTILVFILNYFQEKQMTKFFQKSKKKKKKKKTIMGPFLALFAQIWATFCSNLGKNEFSWKKGSVSF